MLPGLGKIAMTSQQIRQSFLDFFKSKGHTLVPSSSLLPASPNLLFTNAGMNQFVPIFLGQRKADVSKWPGVIPGRDTRAADTQKCIRAGGKHNDLNDVGLDTYHHTFFEMLGNWSFGDYFKREAIDWAWELVTGIWKFPGHRLYATVYSPDKSQGDPSDFDQEAWDLWADKFRAAGLDPHVQIVRGNKKDNFWMMGETGPCGPCSELHVDLTPQGDTKGALVNQGTAECIEIWNLVFIQFNANADGSFTLLPAKHVDTGMGFERVTGIIQNTRNFTEFGRVISNYETDIFRPLFDALEKLSGRKYGSTLPAAGTTGGTEQEKVDVAFRVIADHIRTLSFAIADGIEPGNGERNYVLRRILRRAVRYGRALGFREPFFYKLTGVVAETMGGVFPEVRERRKTIEQVLLREEEAFNETLDRGLALFEGEIAALQRLAAPGAAHEKPLLSSKLVLPSETATDEATRWQARQACRRQRAQQRLFPGEAAFVLYDTYGFPDDLTELLARERGFSFDAAEYKAFMEEQKRLAREGRVTQVIEVSQIKTQEPTRFLGYDNLRTTAQVLEVVNLKDKTAVILDNTTCYAEMGGQVGDTGELSGSGQLWRIVNTQKPGAVSLHLLEGDSAPMVGSTVNLNVEADRRQAIQRHHSVTHVLHWALHEVVSRQATQKGSFVGPDKLTFDFNSGPLSPQQLADVERLVNERIVENAGVSWTEVSYADVKARADIMQVFGDKYGDSVRVVQIGGQPARLDGYSMELCGGTHTRATGEIGLFRIVAESATAAGIRRVEAVAGLEAYRKANEELALLRSIAGRVNSPVAELDKKLEALLAHQKELEKQLKAAQQREASNVAGQLKGLAVVQQGVPVIVHNVGTADGDYLQAIADALKSSFKGVIVLGGCANQAVSLVAAVAPEFTSKIQAGKIIQTIAPIVGGKGGGKPDNARGGGKDAARLEEALAKARTLV
jgi:alanyl-tRNA synthetase